MNGRSNNKRQFVPPRPVLDEFISDYPELSLKFGDIATYKRLRIVESHLVSCFDTDHQSGNKLQLLTISRGAEVLAVTSFGIFQNLQRSVGLDLYARIDLVIAEKKWRGCGISRVLVYCVLIYILKTYGRRLYSISCLAAHDAIAKILESLSFVVKMKDTKGYQHEHLDLEKVRYEDVLNQIQSQVPEVLGRSYAKIQRIAGNDK